MPFFSPKPASQDPESSLRLPAEKRISIPASQRLSTITEGPYTNSHAPPRTAPRYSGTTVGTPRRPGTPRQHSGGTSGRPSQDTQRTAPPAYEWVPEPVDGEEEDLRAPVEGEKLAELRRGGGHARARRRARGGWGRLVLILGLLVLLAIALGVGLGVGLKKRKSNNSANSSSSGQSPGTNSAPAQQFPLGEYSLITALRTQTMNCTSNPSTWRCYPYTIFNPSDSSTNTSSLATFNWIIANTSSTYASNITAATSAQGVPANLTISSTDNPFSITFTNQSLTYISASSNTSSPRYTFSFSMSKAVNPSTSLTSNNAAAVCFFNQTIFTGTLYLNAPSSFPNSSLLAGATGLGGYTPWPYAVEVSQSQAGGNSVPTCYQTVNGAVGAEILTAGLSPQPESNQCLCDYRNY